MDTPQTSGPSCQQHIPRDGRGDSHDTVADETVAHGIHGIQRFHRGQPQRFTNVSPTT